ncbi:MAG: hypothetical protein FGM59_01255 [Candidatus Nanopelagicaceae bacterium]|jgi:uncharacterized membrane protein|nr:hypothetical protein [Candidatus Nanopelagicaceae bacterium]
MIKKVAQVSLGLFLALAGISHLGSNREEFRAQVPTWLPFDADFVVLASGIIEIILGLLLIALWKFRSIIGWVVALFFIAIFPGNVSQYINGIDAFGLDSDRERLIRLFFQPILVLWALWSTEAWQKYRSLRARS